MYKKLLLMALALLLVNLMGQETVCADAANKKEAQFIERVKESVLKLGTGPEARVEVKLRDNARFKGYISEAGEESFMIVDMKTGFPMTIAYPQVKKVKGHNLSTGAKVAIGIGAAIVILVLVFKDHINSY